MSTAASATALRDRVDAVVIGASAGGVAALLQVLPAVKPGLAVPLVVVVHLPRDRPSLLARVFAPQCAVPVREGEDKMPLDPGTIYFSPPDYHLMIDRGPVLALSTDEPVNWSRPSIDVLFESAADVYGDRLAAIILTGANEDGAAGLEAVQRAGGVTIVQDPATAMAAAMPAHALRRVAADFVLPIEDIAAMLRTLAPSTAER